MKSATPLALLCLNLQLLTTGCSSSGVISAGPDTYMVTASGAGFGTAGVREKVYGKANNFCAEKGLVMVPVSFKARPGELGRNPPSADLVFRALKPGDPAIGRPEITDSDSHAEVTQNVRLSVKDETKGSQKTDLYGELVKLDDLKKRGILTDAEFDAAKKRLLEGK
jgi:hypothetical protein